MIGVGGSCLPFCISTSFAENGQEEIHTMFLGFNQALGGPCRTKSLLPLHSS